MEDKDLELLKPLSATILIGFNLDKNAKAVAGDIHTMLASFGGKR